MAGLEALTVRFPSPGEQYDALAESIFRGDLERLLDRALAPGQGQLLLTLTVNSTTPSVKRASVFSEANTNATLITAFPEGAKGQVITILFTSANTTLVDAAGLQLAGGVNFVGSANDVIRLLFNGTNWYEISRSVN